MASNLIQAYDIDQDSNLFSNSTEAAKDAGVVNGPSAMVEDTADHSVYVANANSTFNNIEKFSYDSTTKKLSRIGTSPIYHKVYLRVVCPHIGN